MAKQFFTEPFDDGTKIKLEIFKKYLESWLPTFTKAKNIHWKNIYIYDLFAGAGMDVQGNYGSPLIIVEELKRHYHSIKESGLNIQLVFNDLENDNILKLESEINKIAPKRPYKITFYNEDFSELFDELYPKMIKDSQSPMLFFYDQFGIKHITEKLINKILKLERTDLLFFISSSFVKRFSELNEFQKYLKIKKEVFDDSRPFHCHRIVFQYYQNMIHENKEYYLAPFSIKKGKNIYGLIFGSNHSLGIEKFLNISWKLNSISGNANFNIDEERIAVGELDLFEKYNKPKKRQLFEVELTENILKHNIISKKQIYSFAFNYGCLPKHANSVIKKLVDDGKIGQLKLSSQMIHKLKDETIEVLK
jgi:three-Cys-motif partner protein